MKYALVEQTFNAGLEDVSLETAEPADDYPLPETYVNKIKNLLGTDYVEISKD